MTIEATGSSKYLLGAVICVGLLIAISTIHALYTQDEWRNLLPIIGVSSDLKKGLIDAENKERMASYSIAPFVFPQLYRCPMEISKQPQKDEHMSQSQEDEWLYDKIFSKLPFEQRFGGTFIEIGALDGKKFSNTWYFEKKWDWRGILIEGHPSNSQKLREVQSIRKNCAIFTAAVCNLTNEGDLQNFLFTHGGGATGAAVADASPKFLKKWHKGQPDGKDNLTLADRVGNQRNSSKCNR